MTDTRHVILRQTTFRVSYSSAGPTFRVTQRVPEIYRVRLGEKIIGTDVVFPPWDSGKVLRSGADQASLNWAWVECFNALRIDGGASSYIPDNTESGAIDFIQGTDISISKGAAYWDGAQHIIPMTFAYTGTGATDVNAIHVNVAAEISGITEKVSPASTDMLVIESDIDGNAKRMVQISNLPAGTPGTDSITNVHLANMVQATIKGRADGEGTDDPQDLDGGQVRTIIDVEEGADVTDATNVDAAGAVMDSDFTDKFGFMLRTGLGTYRTVKTKFVSLIDPTVNDDSDAGYEGGSRWLNTTLDKEFVCLDDFPGSAVWKETTAGAGGGDPDQNLWLTVKGDTGETDANSIIDILSILGGAGITTAMVDDILTIVRDALNAVDIGDFDTEVGNHLDVAANTLARHDELHTIESHDGTGATGIELDQLTDGSETSLHTHAESTGDVSGPFSAVDSNIVAFDTTTGKLIKDSLKPLSDIHDELHTIESHDGTGATGTELDQLTDGSETSLHTHDESYGDGDVSGPASAVDGNIAAFDLTTGKLIKDSLKPLSDIHDELHTIESHDGTGATGIELDQLTDGSETSLHTHAESTASLFGSANVYKINGVGEYTEYVASADTNAARGVALSTAIAAAAVGEVIVVRAGVYDVDDLMKTGIGIHFELGAEVIFTGDGVSLFDDNAVAATMLVTGQGVFRNSGTNTLNRRVINLTSGNSELYIEAKDIISDDSVAIRMDGTGAALINCRADSIESSDGTIDNLSNGGIILIRARQLISSLGYVIEQDGGTTKAYGARLYSAAKNPIEAVSGDLIWLEDCYIEASGGELCINEGSMTRIVGVSCIFDSDQATDISGSADLIGCSRSDGDVVVGTGINFMGQDGESVAHIAGDGSDHEDVATNTTNIKYATSPMLVTGGGLSNGTTAGTIKVAAITAAVLRTTASEQGILEIVTVAETDNLTITTPDTQQYYVIITYGASGTSTVSVTDTAPNGQNIIAIGTCMRETDNTVHWNQGGYSLADGPAKAHKRFKASHGIEVVSGGAITESGILEFLIATVKSWAGLNELTAFTTPFNSSLDEFTTIYSDGGTGWTYVTAETSIDEEHYDDGSGTLATIGNNQYGCYWLYIHPSMDMVYVVYGEESYLLPAAEAAQPPTSLPLILTGFGVLLAKIIVQKDATDFTEIQYVTDEVFSGSAASPHNDLTGIQGGLTDEYYHFSSAQHTEALNHVSASSGVHGVTGDVVGTTDVQTLESKTLDEPTIGNFINAQHDHSTTMGGGIIDHAELTPGTGSDHSYIDQTVVIGAAPSFLGTNFTVIPWAGVTKTGSKLSDLDDVPAYTGNEYEFYRINSAASAPETVLLDEELMINIELTVGEEQNYVAPFAMKITGWQMWLSASGSAAVDVWRGTVGVPPQVTGSIVTPSVTTDTDNSAVITAITIAKWDFLTFHVDSGDVDTAVVALTGYRI